MSSLHDPNWQMSSAEQAAIEGLLASLEPRLAIEVGTAQGSSARHLAELVEEVHCFDLSAPSFDLPDKVTMHVGDSHELLPRFLAGLAEEGRNVDLAVVDGDHSASGVRQDIEDLLDSPAVARTVILIHDTANERVRSGVDAVRFAAWPKVVQVHLDWIPGQLFREPGLEHELWYGLGLLVVDASQPAYANGEIFEQRYFPAAPLLFEARDAILERGDDPHRPRRAGEAAELEDLRWELEQAQELIDRQQEALANVLGSPSWRLTSPLRRAKRRAGSLRRIVRGERTPADADRARLD